jgi:hypothetical protein
MRIFIVLICSLALMSVAPGAEQGKKKEQKKGPQQAQVAQPRAAKAPGTGKPTVGGPTQVKQHKDNPTQIGKAKAATKSDNQGHAGQVSRTKHAGMPNNTGKPAEVNKKGVGKAQQTQTGQAAVGGAVGKTKKGQANLAQAKSKPLKLQHFNVPKQPNTAKAPPVKFQPNRRIEGSQHWQGQQYTVFRNYKSAWHDQGWWHSHYGNHIVWSFGAPYYFNSGYWFPAWGYAPNAYYAWDGPIYAYNRLPPDQVIANVQAALQRQGYYHGDVDGLIGPLTREAIANYQRDHGLYTTSTIDQPTLRSLGMA